MIITVEDGTNSAKMLYYQSLVLLYLPCEKFGEGDNENSLYIKAWVQDGCNNAYVKLSVGDKESEYSDSKPVNTKQYADMKNFIGRTFIYCAKKIFGFVPPWGISTGVKPAKLARMYIDKYGNDKAFRILTEEYLISSSKARLAIQACLNEDRALSGLSDNPCSLYVSIPFCPTRCNYCSFVSCTTPRLLSLIPDYLVKLKSELLSIGELIKESGLNLESIYIGGGTPAILDELQTEDLLSTIYNYFEIKNREFTFEAGRPDCITLEKLQVLKAFGVNRVSINTQTTNDKILSSVGRSHTFSHYAKAMELARLSGFECINTDLIAGLPDESVDSFKNSVKQVSEFEPENITVHSFTLKKSSQYKICGKTDFDKDKSVLEMTEFANEYLTLRGYKPYYLYRQKNTVENLDNTGFTKEGFDCIYNIVMMGEYHTVFGAGAGSVTKIVSRDRTKVERVFAPKYPYEFLDSNKYYGFDKEKCRSLIKKGD